MIIVHTKPLILEENGQKYTIFQVLALLMLSKVGLKKLLSHSFSFLWCKHLQSVFMKLCLCLNIRIGMLCSIRWEILVLPDVSRAQSWLTMCSDTCRNLPYTLYLIITLFLTVLPGLLPELLVRPVCPYHLQSPVCISALSWAAPYDPGCAHLGFSFVFLYMLDTP